MEGKPRKSRCVEEEPDLISPRLPPSKKRVFPCHSLARSDWRLLLHAKHTVVHLHTHLEKKKFCLYASSLPYLIPSPRPVIAKQSHRLHSTHSSIPIYTSPSLPPPQRFSWYTRSRTRSTPFFASVRSLFGNDSVLCGEAV